MASLPLPTARRRPFWGNTLVSHIMGDSPPARFDQIHRGGGDLHNNSPGRFEGVVAATTWGDRHCLYRRPRPEDTHSGATRLMPTSWATSHPLGSIKFIEGGEIYITIHQGDLRGFLPMAFLRLFWGNALAARTMGNSPPWNFFWLISKHTTINLILCILFLFFPSPLLLAWTGLNLLFQIEILS
jgi:hypothetical protein